MLIYKFKISIQPDSNLIIPEYRIHLLNKNKKIIDKIEKAKNIVKGFEDKKVETNNKKVEFKNIKTKKTVGKILWVRRKRKNKLN